ncbi:MAG: DUF4258 domain-containing protein [Rhodoplanes sp.]|uniref:DUF4258 domain-containing protein n=1 Tax=Rhodoplanes sp. TaxID=1968906 RepID=UPI001844EAF6|nr:DUF4258 domain-containing protein [Rhodoplanes sp.]
MSAPKPLRFTKHAEDAILERELDRSWIERTARDPEWTQPDPKRVGVERRFREIPEYGNRVLRVACVEAEQDIRVLTVFFDRDARRPS